MALFGDWCDLETRVEGQKRYWALTELPEGRAAVADRLAAIVRSHYDSRERV